MSRVTEAMNRVRKERDASAPETYSAPTRSSEGKTGTTSRVRERIEKVRQEKAQKGSEQTKTEADSAIKGLGFRALHSGMQMSKVYIPSGLTSRTSAADTSSQRESLGKLPTGYSVSDKTGGSYSGARLSFGKAPDEDARYASYLNAEDFEKYSSSGDGKIYISELENPEYIRHMTTDEVKTYNYLKNKEGMESANEYLTWIEPQLTARRGAEMGEAMIDDPFGTVAVRSIMGLENYGRSIEQIISKDTVPLSAMAYANQYLSENTDGLEKTAGDLAFNIGNMAPSVAAGVLHPALAKLSFGASAYGGSLNSALLEGKDKTQAQTYAVLTAASELALQHVLGGIKALGGKVTGDIAKTTIKNISAVVPRVIMDLAIKGTGEFSEEYVQNRLERGFRNLVFNEKNEINLLNEDAAYDGVLGLLTAILLEGGSVTVNTVNSSRIGKALKSKNKQETLVEKVLTKTPDGEAGKLAKEIKNGKMQPNNINIGDLYKLYVKETGDNIFGESTQNDIEDIRRSELATILDEVYNRDVTVRLTEISDKRISKTPSDTRWAEVDFVEAKPESVADKVRIRVEEYGIDAFVVSDSAWEKSGIKAPVYSKNGQIYMRETLDESEADSYVVHEVSHVMKQTGYAPYMEFVRNVPEMLNMSNPIAMKLLERVAKHRNIDISNMTEQDQVKLYDELNAIVYGSYILDNDFIRQEYADAFHDFDVYIAQIEQLHKGFKEERGVGNVDLGRNGESGSSEYIGGMETTASGEELRYGASAQNGTDNGRIIASAGRRSEGIEPPQSAVADSSPIPYGTGEPLGAAFGENGSKAFRTSIPNPTPEQYEAFAVVYNASLNGRELTPAQEEKAAALAPEARYAAEASGRNDADRAAQEVYFGKNAGLVRDDNLKKAKLSRREERILDALARVTGTRIQLVETINEGKDNASEGRGLIKIALDSEDPILVAALHEVVHRLRKISPENYGSIARFIFDNLSDTELARVNAIYGNMYRELNTDGVSEEIVAQGLGIIIGDSKRLDALIADDRTTWQKICDIIHDIVVSIKQALAPGSRARLSDNQKRDFRDLLDKADGLERVLREALERTAAEVQRNTSETQQTQKNTAEAVSGGIKFSKKGSTEELSIKQQMKEHLNELNDMEIVVSVNSGGINGRNKTRLKQDIIDELKPTGYQVDRKGFGKILFAEKEIKGALNYLGTDAEIAAFKALPRVLKRGLIVGEHKNHKVRGYDTTTIAAPIQLNEKRAIMAVVVKMETNNEYKVHRIVAPDGGRFEYTKNRDAEPTPGSVLNSRRNEQNLPISSASDISISNSDENVNTKSSRKYNEAIARQVREELERMGAEYGWIPEGEKAAREVKIPKKTAKDKHVSQTVRTILEAEATPEDILPDIEKMVSEGEFSYDRYTDKAAVADAEATIRKRGWEKAYPQWVSDSKKGKISKKHTALGWALYNNAVNAGDTALAIEILNCIVGNQRSAAQALQAVRILKKLSPETQLYQVQRSIADLQEEINEKYRKDKAPKLVISQELAERFLKAETQEERDAVLKEIYADIGGQIPASLADKWRSWQYLAMLCNPRTHVRNFLGNAAFAPVVAVKNTTATAIEAAVSFVTKGRIERTKSFGKGFGERLSAAWEDFGNVKGAVNGDGKYSDGAIANKAIEEGRRIFKSEALEKARRFNSRVLEAEDMWFSQPHYAFALAQYCQANGISAEQIAKGEGLDKARAYAIREAQKATYRDANILSDFVSRRGRKGLGKKANVLIDGALPFRKTPANVLVRGLEYSPAGLAWTITKGTYDVYTGEKTAAEFIDGISAGLTGTGLAALGFFLAAQMVVRGHGSDDERERELEELMGHQAYSLELPNGMSCTLDWLAPEALPFFAGVNLYEMMQDEKEPFGYEQVLEALGRISEPMLEMSCLQSLNDLFESVGYARSNDTSAVFSIVASGLKSYITQGIPSLGGQLERTGEDVRYTTYTDRNKGISSAFQYELGKASAKIPGFDYGQIPYIDAWGRTETTGNVATRSFNNFINPSYVSQVEESDMEKELLRLYNSTGEASVLPTSAPKYYQVDGETKHLTADEYVSFATKRGQTSRRIIEALTESDAYKSASDSIKVDLIDKAYDYANQTAKAAVGEYNIDKWVDKCQKAKKTYGIPEEVFITLKVQSAEVEALKYDKGKNKGETIPKSGSLLIMEMIYNTKGMNERQREKLAEAFVEAETVRKYNRAKVNEELEEMRGK